MEVVEVDLVLGVVEAVGVVGVAGAGVVGVEEIPILTPDDHRSPQEI